MRTAKFLLGFVAALSTLPLLAQASGSWAPMGKLIYAAQEAYTVPDGRVFVPPSAFSTVAVGPQMLDPSTGLWAATAPTIYGRLGAASLLLVWMFANAVYTLHYAHLFYTSDDGGKDNAGLAFPESSTVPVAEPDVGARLTAVTTTAADETSCPDAVHR